MSCTAAESIEDAFCEWVRAELLRFARAIGKDGKWMFKKFYPAEYVDSTYQIDFEKLWEEGYRSLIFDIDNTLVPHGAPADQRAVALFERLKKIGFSCCLLSNNKEPRVRMFNDAVQVNMIFKAGKPSVKKYLEAVERNHAAVATTVFIGDQIFTDVYGANRAGIHTILVKPIHPKEEIQIVFKRYLEKIVLYAYQKEMRKNERKRKERKNS